MPDDAAAARAAAAAVEEESLFSHPAVDPDSTAAYGDHPDQVIDFYAPHGERVPGQPAPLVVVLHGGAWRAPYDRGTARKVGQINQGSGTTPTFLGRNFVAITDNADARMHVLVYRREASLSHAAQAFLAVVEAQSALRKGRFSFTPEQ